MVVLYEIFLKLFYGKGLLFVVRIVTYYYLTLFRESWNRLFRLKVYTFDGRECLDNKTHFKWNVVGRSVTGMEVAARFVCSCTLPVAYTILFFSLVLLPSQCFSTVLSNHEDVQPATTDPAITTHSISTSPVVNTDAGHDDYICAPGILTPGVTKPKGNIVLEYGNPLEIFCMLNPSFTSTRRNASSIIFYNNDELVPPEFLEVINQTTVRLYIENVKPSKSMYYCKLKSEGEWKEEGVCLNSVAVGFKPREVENFSCVSMNWENLTCSWTAPFNYVKTTTKLVYSLPGRAGARFFYPCPKGTDVLENYCFWDRTTSVVYRQPYDYYNFIMNIQNRFGNLTQKIRFHHYAYVIPSKPVNLTVVNKTSDSVTIQWYVEFPMQTFPPGVVQRVEYQSQWDSRDHWQVVNTSHLNTKAWHHVLNITGLKYAHTVYDVRVFMKSPPAVGQDKWSKPATVTVKTLSAVPGAPPRTDIGSFEVSRGLPHRDIYVYWQQIPEYLYNGDGFEYKVMEVNGIGEERIMEPNEITKTYARFKSLGMKEYHLRIYSYNQDGYSNYGSDLYIPSVHDIVPEPMTFTKISFENGVYELSWKKPLDDSKIKSYTIFWCDNKKDRPYQCTGYLNWTQVPKDTFIKNMTFPDDKVYQLAISANSQKESSGMVWASCTVLHNKVFGKMKSVWISSIGSTFIELGWKLECSDRIGIVKGFRIYYCPLAYPGAKDCKGGLESNTTFMGDPPLTAHGNVTGLKPYTTYMLAISVLTKNGEGIQSDMLFNTTLEDAPDTPPGNVRVSKVTNTTAIVSWNAPSSMNGVLRYYLLYYNNDVIKVEAGIQQVKLERLQSFQTYKVTITACTVSCSHGSEALHFKTLAGIPGIIDQPLIGIANVSEVPVSWGPPKHSGGLLNYYEVKVMTSNEHGNSSKIYPVDGNSTVIEMDCEVDHVGRTLSYRVYVRAVNIRTEDNLSFLGPWSTPGERSCIYNSEVSQITLLVTWIFLIIAIFTFIFGLVYAARWGYIKFRTMFNVTITLPPGLNSPTVEKETDLECNLKMHGWPTDVRKIEHDCKIPPADEELLLRKKRESENDYGDGDSSGCSSAHESVSSSLTSGTHISDSGTEVDQRAESPDEVGGELELSPPPPMSSLRQRNVSSGREGNGNGNSMRLLMDPYMMVMGDGRREGSPDFSEPEHSYPASLGLAGLGASSATTGMGYCRVGSTTSPKASPNNPPLTIPSAIAIPTLTSSGYVSHPPMWSDNKDCCATPPAVPASKGYVVAGSKPQNVSLNKQPSATYCRLGTTSSTDYVTLPSASTNDSSSSNIASASPF